MNLSMGEAISETLDELSVESRTLFTFSVPAVPLQQLLPAGWVIQPASHGPAAGANLYLLVADRLLVQSGQSVALVEQSANKLALLAVPAASDEAQGLVIINGFSARPAGVPGPYKVFVPAEIALVRVLGSGGCERVEEDWSVESGDGSSIRISLKFTRGIPVRAESRTRAISAVDPSLQRVYVADQGADVLQTGGTASTRLEAARVRVGGRYLESLFDGGEHPISVTALPWSIRQAFVSRRPMQT